MTESDFTAGEATALDDRLLEATRLSESGEDAAALRLLLEVEPDHPEHPTLLCMIGALSAQVGAHGMAADYFKRTLAQNPTTPEILVTAGAGLAGSGDPATEPALRLAALTAPDFLPARLAYGAYLVRNGLLEQGLDELVAAQKLDPGDNEVRRQLGIAYLMAGRADEAVAELEAAAEGDDPEKLLLLGLALLRESDVARAAEELHPVADALAQDGETQVVLALTFGAEGWDEAAWLALSRAEAAEAPADAQVVREVEEALESGEDAARALLLEEIAPAALRDRLAGV